MNMRSMKKAAALPVKINEALQIPRLGDLQGQLSLYR
jgi:hypothetical protein